MDKDQSIITQVAAKIAAELATSDKDINTAIASFADAFDAVSELLMGAIYGGKPATTVINQQEEAAVIAAFPQATQSHTIQVVGKQHGELPDWLITACKADGITKVYDNRDGLADNPKRPWFKAVDNKEKAYWPPRGK